MLRLLFLLGRDFLQLLDESSRLHTPFFQGGLHVLMHLRRIILPAVEQSL